ncbi:MAG TPA: GNAT family N-acetyltransferase, partial [Thermoplasmata archaeon]|nr:GNAT family N-acetyltransferase [Thermoplasmata archaeon]
MLPFLRYALKTEPRSVQVGVVDGKVVAFAVTVLRGKWHFLSLFFALPGKQSQGIGKPVLARAFEEPKPPRGSVRCVVASLDLRAQALYLKFGMHPRTVLYFVSGKPVEMQPPRLAVELHQLGTPGRMTKRALDVAARYDRPLRGVRRDQDHRFLIRIVKGSRFFEARRDGRTVGYAMIRGNGAIGPAGVRDPSLSEGLLAAAIAKAHDLGHKNVVSWIPGLNEGALRAAFAAGLKVEFLTVWMASRPLGNLAAYIPANGLLF